MENRTLKTTKVSKVLDCQQSCSFVFGRKFYLSEPSLLSLGCRIFQLKTASPTVVQRHRRTVAGRRVNTPLIHHKTVALRPPAKGRIYAAESSVHAQPGNCHSSCLQPENRTGCSLSFAKTQYRPCMTPTSWTKHHR